MASSSSTMSARHVVAHLAAPRGASALCARPRRLPTGSPASAVSAVAVARPPLLRRCYSTHTPDDPKAPQPSTFADKWQREFRAGVGLDRPDAAAAGAAGTAGTATATAADDVAAQYFAHRQQQQQLSSLGADISPHYQPHTLLTHPPSPADVTLELLLASEAHQGHATSLWNPANARYIHGIRQGIHIISLEVTAAHLRRAAKVVQEVARRGGIVLFVGTRDGQDRAVSRAAELAKGCHLFERWIPGSITNGKQILGKCRTKVVNEHDADVPGFEEQLYDRAVLKPDLVVCLNPLENYVLLHECALNNIPTIGVIDTNADPTWVTYPIPANDDR